MSVKATRITYWRIFAATLLTAIGWGLSWIIGLLYAILFYFDHPIPLRGAIIYNLVYGLIGITATLIGLRIVRVRLPLTHIVIAFTAWGISAIGLTLLTFGDAANVSNTVFTLQPFHELVFGVALTLLLIKTINGLTIRDALIMGVAWLLTAILQLIFLKWQYDHQGNEAVIWLFVSTPLSTVIAGALGGGVTFWRIRHTLKNTTQLEEDSATPAVLGELMQSRVQQTAFEVVHDDGKPKAKRKPKPSRWSAIPHLRVYMGALVIAVLLAIGISTFIVPVREVRIPGFITPNPTNSTPGPQWGNRLPPTNPHWRWNSTVMTNSPIANIPPNSIVTLGQSFYDFGADMWWYKATTNDGYTADAWEWQISLTMVPPPATTAPTVVTQIDLNATLPPTPTPINGVITLGKDSSYRLIARLFDGVYWQYTLQAADGSSQTVDAAMVKLDAASAALPPTLFMDKVGTMQAELVTRQTVGAILPQTPVQLIKIIWYTDKAPVYLISPNPNSPQPIVAEATADQLENAA